MSLPYDLWSCFVVCLAVKGQSNRETKKVCKKISDRIGVSARLPNTLMLRRYGQNYDCVQYCTHKQNGTE
jgi:hypothetical protein